MLYIFWVNNGQMMTFDMNLAIETVDNLKRAIYEQYKIPIINQVLLISGGESLNSDDRVCQYSSAGTDTSPIFLFCKNYELLMDQFEQQQHNDNNDDMKDRVQSCLQMEPNFNTVVSRNEMAIQLYENDSQIYHCCKQLVHDQHLQQQSWASVVANLEDLVQSFENKSRKVELLYQDILRNKTAYLKLLENFKTDKELLGKIPILNSLISMKTMDDSSHSTNYQLSLLDWIQQKDNHNILDELFCMEELNDYNDEKLENLRTDISNVLGECNNMDMKEIKGLTQRLSALEQFIRTAKKNFEKQGILTEGFKQNQSRISDLQDPTILPDLCQNHSEQLQTMLNNHLELIDLEHKFRDAKFELSRNLNQRLRWIIHVQEQLKHVDEMVVVIGIKLQKLRTNLEIIQRLHQSPKIYLDSIQEVLRRKMFTKIFYDWAEKISRQAKNLIEQEQLLRQKFTEKIDNHFLRCFFPGMNDLPEQFFNEPIRIDQLLPNITVDDLEYLRKKLPEMFNDNDNGELMMIMPFNVPFDTNEINVVAEKSSSSESSQSDSRSIDHQDIGIMTELSLNNIDQLEMNELNLKKDLQAKMEMIENLRKNCETIETKNENQKILLKRFRLLCDDLMEFYRLNSTTTTDLKQQLSSYGRNFFKEINHLNEYLNEIINEMNQLQTRSSQQQQTITELTDKNANLENQIKLKNSQIKSLEQKLSEERIKNEECWKQIQEQFNRIETFKSGIINEKKLFDHFQLSFKDLNLNYQNYHQEIENLFIRLNEELRSIQETISTLEQKHQTNIESIRKDISVEKDRQIQRLREQLLFDHKNELESLRQRFKLAISTTSIERTASETSLEKVQLDIVDQSAQEKEIQKLKSMLIEQRNEYEQTIQTLRNDHEKSVQTLRLEMDKQQTLRENIVRKKTSSINNEFEMNLDFLMQKMSLYESFLSRLNSRIGQNSSTTISTSVDTNVEMKNEKSDEINFVKELAKDFNDFNRNVELLNSRSFISIPTTPDSPKLTTKLAQHLNVVNIDPNIDDKVTANSCEIGDTVLVYYEKKYENFIVYTSLSNLHYIHSDSFKEFDLTKDPITNEYDWIIAKVTEKEYCQIKKEENRYKLPVNTKFFRVKIQPISKFPSNQEKFKQLAQMNRLSSSSLISHPNNNNMPTSTSSSLLSSSTSTITNRNILSNFISLFASSSSSSSNTVIGIGGSNSMIDISSQSSLTTIPSSSSSSTISNLDHTK
ncbi:autophagy-related 17 [Dermatophagoides pteronyssinus]|uniref:autophagy-related 17 n=1 Tax=Dermatophagoides pteronyssinus TaxID=6956 RepID=UPI003F6748FC